MRLSQSLPNKQTETYVTKLDFSATKQHQKKPLEWLRTRPFEKGSTESFLDAALTRKTNLGIYECENRLMFVFFYTVLPKQTSAHIFAKGKTGLNLPLQFFVSLEGAVQS